MFTSLINLRVKHNPTKLEKIESKKTTLSVATKLYKNKERVAKSFKENVFLYRDGFRLEEESKEKQTKTDVRKLSEFIKKRNRDKQNYFKNISV